MSHYYNSMNVYVYILSNSTCFLAALSINMSQEICILTGVLNNSMVIRWVKRCCFQGLNSLGGVNDNCTSVLTKLRGVFVGFLPQVDGSSLPDLNVTASYANLSCSLSKPCWISRTYFQRHVPNLQNVKNFAFDLLNMSCIGLWSVSEKFRLSWHELKDLPRLPILKSSDVAKALKERFSRQYLFPVPSRHQFAV